MLLYVLGVVLFVIGIAASIALHEVGHMLPAKKFGMKVTQYFVGFGRTLWSVRRGETEYGLKAIPLGGFVKIVGMLPPGKGAEPGTVRDTNTGLFTQLVTDAREAEYEHVDPEDEGRLFYAKPWWQKLIVMSGGPFVNVLIATALYAVMLMGIGVMMPTTTVQHVSDCAISDAEAGRTCTADDPVTPARSIGLQEGDTIVSFNGKPTDDWETLTALIRDNGSAAATIAFERDGRTITEQTTTTVLARADLDDPDKTIDVGFLGVSPTFANQTFGPGMVAETMVDLTQQTAVAILHLPERMVGVAKSAFGAERSQDSPVSVVGASRVAGEMTAEPDLTWADRAVNLLGLLAAVNLFLALFNLVPLLPLDGGHIAGAVYEALRRGAARLFRRPDPGYVDVAKMLPVAYGVGALLIMMSVILIYADIVNPVRLT